MIMKGFAAVNSRPFICAALVLSLTWSLFSVNRVEAQECRVKRLGDLFGFVLDQNRPFNIRGSMVGGSGEAFITMLPPVGASSFPVLRLRVGQTANPAANVPAESYVSGLIANRTFQYNPQLGRYVLSIQDILQGISLSAPHTDYYIEAVQVANIAGTTVFGPMTNVLRVRCGN